MIVRLLAEQYYKRKSPAAYFKKLKNPLGVLEIDGIRDCDDQDINRVYNEIKSILDLRFEVANAFDQSLPIDPPESLVKGIVRDALIIRLHNGWVEYESYKASINFSQDISSLFVKGRTY